MRTVAVFGVLAALCGDAAAQSDDWQEQNRKEIEANNYKIAIQQMEEVVKQQPAPGPGLETAPVRAPAWCGQKKGNYTRGQALDSTRSQLANMDRYWMDALLGAAERICDGDANEPVVQRAGAFIEQHWINQFGLSSRDAVESIRARLDKQGFEDGQKKLCAALKVSDEVQGAVRKHMAAKRELFDCGGDRVTLVATAPMTALVPWLDASGTEPDEVVRLAYVAFESRATLSSDDYLDKTILYYVVDQYDYKAFQPDKVLALLDTEPYQGNPYAQAVTREQMALARVRMAAVEAEVKKRTDKDADWKELLITAPRRGFDAWAAAAGKWKAELARSNEFEDKSYGPSLKALSGCGPTLKKDLTAVLKTLKHDTAEELKREISDNLVAGLLLGRYLVCLAADGEPLVASGWRKHMEQYRVTRGPRAAGYYAALDAVAKIREDRTKFPVGPNDLPIDRADYLQDQARDLLSNKKYDTLGFSDVRKGVVKTAKKGAKGVAITFNPDRRQIYTESCTTTNRIVTFEADGDPIYYRNCKPTGLEWIDEKPQPILVANDLAGGLASGKMIVFAVVPYNYGDRIAMPLEVYADNKGKKLISYFGIDL